jgi:sucrose-6-phosphate hydrolase SacC (GH32 family)
MKQSKANTIQIIKNQHRRAFLRNAGIVAAFGGLGSAQSTPSGQTDVHRDSGDDDLVLNYHLMHPGGASAPGDPNAAFYLDGTYHLHYILRHPFRGKDSFSFVHVSSPDMLHWVWHKTILQPAFTGHGMFSGTGFITKEGRPAIIYHGQGSGRNQIAVATDRRLEDWEKPYPLEPMTVDGKPANIPHWDPDCFLIGNTYHAISGGRNPVLMKSPDLKKWTYTGSLFKNELADVVMGEDVSCGNSFSTGQKWILLCISHSLGCRYYINEWVPEADQFVSLYHGRMNWRRDDQSLYDAVYRDFFAPESVLAADGRRVMWAWCATLDKQIDLKTLQSLPRELSLPADGVLRIRPLRELESLRYDAISFRDLKVSPRPTNTQAATATLHVANLEHDAMEVRIVVERSQAERKRFGVQVFAGDKGDGLPVLIKPETGTIRVGKTEAPFTVASLPPNQDLEIRIFIDKYIVEVFVADRQALIAAYLDYRQGTALKAYSFGDPTTIKTVEIWKLRPTNQGFLEARRNRIWQPETT